MNDQRRPWPVIEGEPDGKGGVRVNEADLEPGMYVVQHEGKSIGTIRVTDPVVGYRTNRADRRRKSGGQGVHRRRDLYGARWGRD